MFVRDDGTPLPEDGVRKAFKGIARRAGLAAYWSPHNLRHTMAVMLIQQGVPLPYVKEQLGHSSIQVTVDIYGRWLPTGDKGFVDALDGGGTSRGLTDLVGDQLVTNPTIGTNLCPQVIDSIEQGIRLGPASTLRRT